VCIGRPSTDPLDPDYVPTIFSHTRTSLKHPERQIHTVQRADRSKQRLDRKRRCEAADAMLSLGTETVCDRCCQTETVTTSAATQTDLTWDCVGKMMDEHAVIVQEKQSLENKVAELQAALDSATQRLNEVQQQLDEQTLIMQRSASFSLDAGFLQNSDVKVKFYTGLPNYQTFRTVVDHAVQISSRRSTKIGQEQELLWTFVKLRQNPGLEDIAYRCQLSVSSVTTFFHYWLDILYRLLGGLILWPDTDRLQLPSCFQNPTFRRVRCIIDCTEFFIERPSSLKARAQTYSNYKRHNTVKLLIGISPSGCITFLSPCWGGRASDRVITVQSGLLDKFFPGDIVLADRGFTMKDDFALKGVQLLVPAFTRGKKQLTAEEVETSRQMSRVRIHVERVIGRVKDFRILRDTLPITLIRNKGQSNRSAVQKIVTVVCAVVNMNKPIL